MCASVHAYAEHTYTVYILANGSVNKFTTGDRDDLPNLLIFLPPWWFPPSFYWLKPHVYRLDSRHLFLFIGV